MIINTSSLPVALAITIACMVVGFVIIRLVWVDAMSRKRPVERRGFRSMIRYAWAGSNIGAIAAGLLFGSGIILFIIGAIFPDYGVMCRDALLVIGVISAGMLMYDMSKDNPKPSGRSGKTVDYASSHFSQSRLAERIRLGIGIEFNVIRNGQMMSSSRVWVAA